MKLINRCLICLLLMATGLVSCKKDVNSTLNPPNPEELLNFSSIRSYPAGHVEIVFELDCNHLDTSQYDMEWIQPQNGIKWQSNQINIDSNYSLKYNLIAKNTLQTFAYVYDIEIDTIYNNYDYRAMYTGNYDFIIYIEKDRWSADNSIKALYDTMKCDGVVDYFTGYTAGSDVNYSNVEYKIGITYAEYSLDNDNSRCANSNYYTDGFLHPTIDMKGNMTYPELELCDGGFSGYIREDTLILKYYWGDKWENFSYEIFGHKVD